jgi:hypothetical protein
MFHCSASVQIRTCPIGILKQPFTLLNDAKVITNTFGRRFPTGRLINLTSLLIYKSVDRPLPSSIHNNFVILLASLKGEVIITLTILQVGDAGIVVLYIRCAKCVRTNTVVNEVLTQCFTQLPAILNNIQLDGILGITLSTEVTEVFGEKSRSHPVRCV